MAQCEAEGRKLPAMDLYAGIFNSKLYSSNREDRHVHQLTPRHVDNWPMYAYSASPVPTTQHSQTLSKETKVENSDSIRAKLDIHGQSDADNQKKSHQLHAGNHSHNPNPKNSVSDVKSQLKESDKLSPSLQRSNLGSGTQNQAAKDVEGSYLIRERTSESPVTRNGKFVRADDLVYSSDGSSSLHRASDVSTTDDLAVVVSQLSVSSSKGVAKWGTLVDPASLDNDAMPVLEKDLGEQKVFSSGTRFVMSGEINSSSRIAERNKVEDFAHNNDIDEGFKNSKCTASRKSGEMNSGRINDAPRFNVLMHTNSHRSGEQEVIVNGNGNGKSSPNAYVSKDRGNAFMSSVRVRGQASSDSASSHGGSSNGGSPTAAEATRDGRMSSFGNILMSKGSPKSISSRSLGNHGNSSPSPNKNSLNGSPVSQLRQGNILGRKSGEMTSNRKSSELVFDDQLRGSATHRMGADGMGNIYSTGSGSNRGLYDTMFNDHLRGSATHRMSVDGNMAKGNQQINGNGSPLHNGSLLVGGANGNVLSYGGGNGKMDQKQGDMTNSARATVDSSFLKLVQSSNDPEDLKNAGNEYYRRRFFTEAVILYDRAIALSPTNAAYRGNRAAALTGLGRLAEAVQDCEEALQLDPLYVRVHQRVALIYLRLGLLEKAYEHLHAGGQEIDLIELQRLKTIERHLSRCVEARKLRDWYNVIRESDAAVVAGADSAPQVFGYKCEALLKLNRPDEADNICNVAQRVETSLVNMGIMPATPFLLNIRSQVDLALGRFDEAVGASESAAQISPNDFETTALLRKARTVSQARSSGNELFKSGKYFEAIALYTEGLESDPTNSVLFCNRAACRMKLEQWEKAVEDCDAALRLQPHYVKALMRRAQCLTKLERWEDALQDYEVLRREMPCDIEVARSFFDVQVAIRKSHGEEVFNMKFGGEVEEVVNNEHYRDVISSPGLSVVQFITRWSDRCRQLSPFVEDLCRRHPCVHFLKVDVEDHPYIAKSECVTFIPTFKIYKNGQKVKEIQGPTEQSLEYALQHYSL